MVREDITEKMAFEQSFEAGEGELLFTHLWECLPLPFLTYQKGQSQMLTHPNLSPTSTSRCVHSLSRALEKLGCSLNLFSDSSFLTQTHVLLETTSQLDWDDLRLINCSSLCLNPMQPPSSPDMFNVDN